MDLAQTLLLGTVLTLLAWPTAVAIPKNVGAIANLYSAYVLPALVSITSLLTQQGRIRRLVFALSVMLCTYAVTTIAAVWLFQRYGFVRNPPVWAFGDTALILYAMLLIWAGRTLPVCAPKAALRTSQHISPMLVTALLLLMAIEIRRRDLYWGAIVGVGGLLIYAVRTTLLNDRYLGERDRLIALEAKRTHALIDIVHEIRSPWAAWS